MNYFQVNLMNPKVLVGAFIGAMAAFLFCGLTMEAVGRAAQKMVEEVRRQFREIPGILEGTGTPDYGSCVEISTRAAQHEMIFPSLLGHCYSYRRRLRSWRGWRIGLARWRIGRWLHPRRLHGQCRWSLGQCQENG